MRRLGALLLVFGLATPACFAGTGETEPASNSVPWYRRVFLGERKNPAPANTTKDRASPDGPKAAPIASSRELTKKQWAEENRIYLERLQAISRIRRIASDQGDEALLQKADDLEVQAEELFTLRTARLPKLGEGGDDRAALERGRDERPASAARPAQRRPSMRGSDR